MIADLPAGKQPTAEFPAFYEATVKVIHILTTFLRMAANVSSLIITAFARTAVLATAGPASRLPARRRNHGQSSSYQPLGLVIA
jgi:hypothetical protein